MALIGKIRQNFWFVLILLGFALLAFILMDMTSASNRGGSSISAGSINGKDIDMRDFQRTQSILYSGSGADQGAIKNAVWDFFVEDAIVAEEAEGLGLSVPSQELMDLQFGANPSPIIRQNFADRATGQVNRQVLNTYKTAIEEGTFDNEQQRQFWKQQENQIVKTRLQEKINAMVSKAMYTPTWMVKENYKHNNLTADVAMVKIPFSAGGEVDVTDAAVSSYIADNASQYEVKEETRVGEYVVFDITATAADSAVHLNTATELATQFKNSQNDSIFAISNGGSYVNYYYKAEELPATIQDQVNTMAVGDVYGPYQENGAYNTFKLSAQAIVPDSVKASHILRNVDPTNPSSLIAANNLIDSLKTQLEAGNGNFAELATANSQDPGSAAKGGDLGYFVQGTMVPGFKDACFYYGKEGNYYKVQTQFGIHLIYIEDQKFLNKEPKYKVGFTRTAIKPTEGTQEAVNTRVADLVGENRTLASLKEAISADASLSSVTTAELKQSDYIIGNLGGGVTSENIISWLFDEDNNIGDVSPEVYNYQNPQEYYYNKAVAVALKDIYPAGLPKGERAMNLVETKVSNMLKGEAIIAKINATDLSSIASSFNATIDTVKNLKMITASPGLLNAAPKAVASAFAQNDGDVSKPIIGDDGVYVVKTITKYAAPEASNIPQLRSVQSTAARSQVNFQLIQALKEGAEIEDKRFINGL